MKWKQNKQNEVLAGDGFFVSYNPNCDNVKGTLSAMVEAQIEIKMNSGAETALIKDNLYFILKGDWRTEYEGLVAKGFDACYEFYLSKKAEYQSNWSSDYPIWEHKEKGQLDQ